MPASPEFVHRDQYQAVRWRGTAGGHKEVLVSFDGGDNQIIRLLLSVDDALHLSASIIDGVRHRLNSQSPKSAETPSVSPSPSTGSE